MLEWAFFPLNAFYKGFVVEGDVMYHFSSAWAWEIAQAAYVFAQSDTGLQDQLVNNFGVKPTLLTSPLFLGSSNLVFTPFYGKLAGAEQVGESPRGLLSDRPGSGQVREPGGVSGGNGRRSRPSVVPDHPYLSSIRRSGFPPDAQSFEVLADQWASLALGLSVEFGGAER